MGFAFAASVVNILSCSVFMPKSLAAVLTVLFNFLQCCPLRLSHPYMMQPANTLLMVHLLKLTSALFPNAEALKAPQEVYPLLCLVENALNVEGLCKCVCVLCVQNFRTAKMFDGFPLVCWKKLFLLSYWP